MNRRKILISILSVVLLVSVLVFCCLGCDSLKSATQKSDKVNDKTVTSDTSDKTDNVPTFVYVKGYVTSVGENKNKYQKNIYIADVATATRDNSLLVYSADYGTGITALAQGDCIIVKGFLANYKGTAEMTSYKDENGAYTNQEIVWKGTGESDINTISVAEAKNILKNLSSSEDEVVYYIQKKAVSVNTVSGMSLKTAFAPSNSDDSTISSSYTLVASFDEDSIISAVTWTASWLNSSSTWATGKDVNDYISLVVNSENSMECVVSKVSSSTYFNEPIIVKVRSVSFPNVYATCRVDNKFWCYNVNNFRMESPDLTSDVVHCLSILNSSAGLCTGISSANEFEIPQEVHFAFDFTSWGTTTPEFDFYISICGQEFDDLNAILQKYGMSATQRVKVGAAYAVNFFCLYSQDFDLIYDALFFEDFLEALENKNAAAYEVAYYLAHVDNYFMKVEVYNKNSDVKLGEASLGFAVPEDFLDDYCPVNSLSISPEGIVL